MPPTQDTQKKSDDTWTDSLVRYRFKIGQKKQIYKNWQENKKLLGTFVLVKPMSIGKTFIPMSEKEQHTKVFGSERWVVRPVRLTQLGASLYPASGFNPTVNIRYLVGENVIHSVEAEEPNVPARLIEDDFSHQDINFF